jgi:hypothetical protein
MIGGIKAGGPQVIAFHPMLNLGVAQGANYDFHFFNAKSLAVKKTQTIKPDAVNFWFNLLTFGGRGTRLIALQGEHLHFVPLDLSADERATLTKVFGKLPETKATAATPEATASSEPTNTEPSKSGKPKPKGAKSPAARSKSASSRSAAPQFVDIDDNVERWATKATAARGVWQISMAPWLGRLYNLGNCVTEFHRDGKQGVAHESGVAQGGSRGISAEDARGV